MITLYPFQDQIISETTQAVREGVDCVLINSAVGSGKTAMAARLLERCAAKGFTGWFICHRREILRQNYLTLTDTTSTPIGIVGAGFLAQPVAPIQVCSIGSLIRRHSKLPKPNLIIWDEVHHLPSKSWAALYEHYRGKTIHIGLSASPQRLDGRGLGQYFKKMVSGPSVRELIDGGYLSPYRLFAPHGPDLSGIHTVAGDYDRKELNDVMKGSTVMGDCVSTYLAKTPGKRGLVFTWSVESSIEIAKRFNDAGVPAAHIDGTTDERQRDHSVKQFANKEIKILSNVDICGEGFNIPACDALFELRPTQSLSLWILDHNYVFAVLRPSANHSSN